MGIIGPVRSIIVQTTYSQASSLTIMAALQQAAPLDKIYPLLLRVMPVTLIQSLIVRLNLAFMMRA